jgi:hypothetical protein
MEEENKLQHEEHEIKKGKKVSIVSSWKDKLKDWVKSDIEDFNDTK